MKFCVLKVASHAVCWCKGHNVASLPHVGCFFGGYLLWSSKAHKFFGAVIVQWHSLLLRRVCLLLYHKSVMCGVLQLCPLCWTLERN